MFKDEMQNLFDKKGRFWATVQVKEEILWNLGSQENKVQKTRPNRNDQKLQEIPGWQRREAQGAEGEVRAIMQGVLV